MSRQNDKSNHIELAFQMLYLFSSNDKIQSQKFQSENKLLIFFHFYHQNHGAELRKAHRWFGKTIQ
jgi:hypothetical protein